MLKTINDTDPIDSQDLIDIEDNEYISPGTLRWLISADESGWKNSKYYGFGCLWMKYQRRGDFVKDIRQLRAEHSYWSEIKWNKAHTKKYRDFYYELIEYFFMQNWLAFHCLVVEKTIVDKSLHDDSFKVGFYKHYQELISNGIKKCLNAHPNRQAEFRVWIDNLSTGYSKQDEAMDKIISNVLKKELGNKYPVTSVISKDSRKAVNIQIADLLLGAVMEAWQCKSSSQGKSDLQKWIASHLGWPDLKSDTKPKERKFNIWKFHPEPWKPRDIVTRDVSLHYKI